MSDPEATPDSTVAPPMAAAHDPYAVLRDRNVSLYLVGRLFASFGQQMLTVAVGWELYERTHSALALGLVGLTQMVPMVLFTLPAGHVADNYNRQRVIVLMTFIIACASLGRDRSQSTTGPISPCSITSTSRALTNRTSCCVPSSRDMKAAICRADQISP